MEPRRLSWPPGTVFADRYEVEALLGRGGMAEVYRVRDLALAEVVALKLIGPDANTTAVLRLRQEVRLARRITHPNVGRVYDIGEHEGRFYLTMEYVAGKTLAQLLRERGPLDRDHAFQIGRALVEGLRAAHAAGVAHRDLKPTNVVLGDNGRVVIVDFGIAYAALDEVRLTEGPVGTPSYMAPEQIVGAEVDSCADVYAFGLVLHELLTGALPRRVRGGAVLGAVPSSAASLIMRCLEILPSARPTAEELARMLAAVEVTTDQGTTLASPIAEGTHASSPLAPANRGDRTVAVLPFRYQGHADASHLGDAIAEELVDTLSRTRGLRVLGIGATARFREQRDVRAIGRDLRADAVVDGTVIRSESRVRLTVKLLEADTGVQVWSDRLDGALTDVFEFGDSIACRVAEKLRVEMTALAHRGNAPVEAIDAYLFGRARIRQYGRRSIHAATEAFERCLSLAPDFAPGLAGHALVCQRAWFAMLDDRPWRELARASVARALARASSIADTHVAAALDASNGGRYDEAIHAIANALRIAPTCADAHWLLGILLTEAGPPEEGVRHLELAAELDPILYSGKTTVARYYALRGRYEEAEAILTSVEQHSPGNEVITDSCRVRFAAWRGRIDEAIALSARLETTYGETVISRYAPMLAGKPPDLPHAETTRARGGERLATLFLQLVAEALAARGDPDAIGWIERAGDVALLDVDWLEHCPVLAAVREDPRFVATLARARYRAAGVRSAVVALRIREAT